MVTKDNPEVIESHIDFIIDQINNKIPRVKWESSRVIANLAPKYPEIVRKAIGKLLINSNDEGTVVKWSAAFALAEIAKHNPQTHKELISEFEKIVKKEENNGVRKIYIKALKDLKK